MPLRVRKIRNQDLYTVKDTDGNILSKGTTFEKAQTQKRIIESGAITYRKKKTKKVTKKPKRKTANK